VYLMLSVIVVSPFLQAAAPRCERDRPDRNRDTIATLHRYRIR